MIFASFSKVFSSYIEGSKIILGATQFTRNDTRHSEAETLMLNDEEARNSEIFLNASGSFWNVSSGSI